MLLMLVHLQDGESLMLSFIKESSRQTSFQLRTIYQLSLPNILKPRQKF